MSAGTLKQLEEIRQSHTLYINPVNHDASADYGQAYVTDPHLETDQYPETIDSDPVSDEKKKRRLLKNRESAHQSRQRKKHYVAELEKRSSELTEHRGRLLANLSALATENKHLRDQLMCYKTILSQAGGTSPIVDLCSLNLLPSSSYSLQSASRALHHGPVSIDGTSFTPHIDPQQGLLNLIPVSAGMQVMAYPESGIPVIGDKQKPFFLHSYVQPDPDVRASDHEELSSHPLAPSDLTPESANQETDQTQPPKKGKRNGQLKFISAASK